MSQTTESQNTAAHAMAEMHAATDLLREAASRYKRACEKYHRAWIEGLAPTDSINHLIGVAASRRSTWSGGFSVGNMIEQIEREVTADMAAMLSRRL